MTRIQIHLPDDLYQRAKRVAAEPELSLAETTRRGLELFLARYPDPPASKAGWSLPVVNCGGIKVPLARLRKIFADDEEARGRAEMRAGNRGVRYLQHFRMNLRNRE